LGGFGGRLGGRFDRDGVFNGVSGFGSFGGLRFRERDGGGFGGFKGIWSSSDDGVLIGLEDCFCGLGEG
jgi:hypothetical protein